MAALLHYLKAILAGCKKEKAQEQTITARAEAMSLMKEKFAAAVKIIKSSELGKRFKGNTALYALPWFVVIGDLGVGKSALLKKSGFSCNYHEVESLGFKHTENSDWWFTDHAIFLKLAGFYLASENREQWLEFLILLKKYRPRLPCNELIVVLNLSEIISFSKEQLRQYVQNLRVRISEFYYQLSYVVPIIVAFSKFDCLTGFEEFFADLNELEKKQYFGFSFGSSYQKQLDHLYTRLSLLRFNKIAKEADISRRFAIFSFPEQFYQAKIKIGQLLVLLLAPNPYQEVPLPRGIYFTSNKSSRTAPDGYFIAGLFEEIINFSKRSVMHTGKQVKLNKISRSILLLFCGFIIVSFGIFFGLAAHKNITVLKHASSAAVKLADNDSPAELQTVFNDYHLLLNSHGKVPWYLRLGIYRGDVLLPSLAKLLADNIEVKFTHTMGDFLADKLKMDYAIWGKSNASIREEMRGSYYSALKAYLFLCAPPRKNFLESAAVLAPYWNLALYGETAVDRKLGSSSWEMIKFYLQQASPLSCDHTLTAKGERQLSSASQADNLAAELVYLSQAWLEDYKLNEQESIYSKLSVPGIYTAEGWQYYVKNMVDSMAEGDESLRQKLTEAYFINYKEAWVDFMGSIRVRQFASLDNAENKLKILSSDKSPIVETLKDVKNNTDLPELRSSFADLNKTADSKIKIYFTKMEKIRSDLQSLELSPNPSHEAGQYAARILTNSGESQLHQALAAASLAINDIGNAKMRDACRSLLLQPIYASWQVVLKTARSDIEQDWQAQILKEWQQVFADKFPFNSDAQGEVSAKELSNFLQPNGGTLWNYMRNNLQPFLTNTAGGWQEKTWLGLGVGFNPAALRQLERLELAVNSLLAGDKVILRYQVYPFPNKDLIGIQLIFSGQKYVYSNGPQVWQEFVWQNSAEQTYALTAILTSGANITEIRTSGIWGLLRLIKNGKAINVGNNTYKITWQLLGNDGRKYPVTILLRPLEHAQLFQSLLFGKFCLPANIV